VKGLPSRAQAHARAKANEAHVHAGRLHVARLGRGMSAQFPRCVVGNPYPVVLSQAAPPPCQPQTAQWAWTVMRVTRSAFEVSICCCCCGLRPSPFPCDLAPLLNVGGALSSHRAGRCCPDGKEPLQRDPVMAIGTRYRPSDPLNCLIARACFHLFQ
jgi:hypothetical protein